MKIIEAFAVKNKCYQAGAPLTPRGIMLHSVGTPQPSAAVFARSFNQYQPGGVSVCVHAFAQADGTVYQTLPWEMRGWHCGGAASLNGFPDAASVSNWAYAAMSWAVGNGLISGIASDGADYLAPSGGATRAQIAAIMMRYCRLTGL